MENLQYGYEYDSYHETIRVYVNNQHNDDAKNMKNLRWAAAQILRKMHKEGYVGNLASTGYGYFMYEGYIDLYKSKIHKKRVQMNHYLDLLDDGIKILKHYTECKNEKMIKSYKNKIEELKLKIKTLQGR